MDIYNMSENSQREVSGGKRTEFKQVRLDFAAANAQKQFVEEKKKRVRPARAGFFNQGDEENSLINLPKNISNEELMQYLKSELMNIENKIDQLTMKKQKILELINGVVIEMDDKFEQMKYEHIEMDELLLTEDSFKKGGLATSTNRKPAEIDFSLFNLARYNFNEVDYSIFPMLEQDIKDDDTIEEEDLVTPNLQSKKVKGVSITNSQLKGELKRLDSVKSMDSAEVKYMGSQYGIKSEEEVCHLNHFKV